MQIAPVNNFPTKIAEVVLSTAAATIDFASIPGTHRHLRVAYQARGDAVATSVQLGAQFNGDTAANYDFQRHYANNGTSGAFATVGATFAQVAWMDAASADAGHGSVGTIEIPNYAGTTFWKNTLGYSMAFTSTTAASLSLDHLGGQWRSTAAITRLTLVLGSGNFVAGTVATLYGW